MIKILKTYFQILLLVLLTFFYISCSSEKERVNSISEHDNIDEIITLKMDGCKTEYFLIIMLAEHFKLKTSIEIEARPTGNNVAIKNLLNGEIDLCYSCISINKLAENIVEVQENFDRFSSIIIAKDAMAVIVNPTNPINNITEEDLAEIYKGNITLWSELGWIDGGEIVPCRIKPDIQSGCALVFKEMTIGMDSIFGPNTVLALSDNEMAALIRKNSNMIGYCVLNALPGGVKPLLFNGINPCIENVINGKYNLVTTYRLITIDSISEEVKDFIEFVISEHGKEVINVRFISVD